MTDTLPISETDSPESSQLSELPGETWEDIFLEPEEEEEPLRYGVALEPIEPEAVPGIKQGRLF